MRARKASLEAGFINASLRALREENLSALGVASFWASSFLGELSILQEREEKRKESPPLFRRRVPLVDYFPRTLFQAAI